MGYRVLRIYQFCEINSIWAEKLFVASNMMISWIEGDRERMSKMPVWISNGWIWCNKFYFYGFKKIFLKTFFFTFFFFCCCWCLKTLFFVLLFRCCSILCMSFVQVQCWIHYLILIGFFFYIHFLVVVPEETLSSCANHATQIYFLLSRSSFVIDINPPLFEKYQK